MYNYGMYVFSYVALSVFILFANCLLDQVNNRIKQIFFNEQNQS